MADRFIGQRGKKRKPGSLGRVGERESLGHAMDTCIAASATSSCIVVCFCVSVFRMPSHNSTIALAACRITVFGFSLADFVSDGRRRDMNVVEIWSGVGAIVAAAAAQGLQAAPFDKYRTPGVTDTQNAESTEDILSQVGFLRAVHLVTRLVEGGLLWLAPVCASFVFMNASRCKRRESNGFRGDVGYQPVADGNLGADIAAFLFYLAFARGAQVVLENPSCSSIWRYPAVAALGHLPLHECLSSRCAWDSRPYGQRFLKQYKLIGTGAWIGKVRRSCKCPGKEHLSMVYHEPDGRVTGDKGALRQSAAYPSAMGKAIVKAWLSVSLSSVPVLRRSWLQTLESDEEGESEDHSTTRSSQQPSRPQRAQSWANSPDRGACKSEPERAAPSSKRRKWLITD